MTETPPPAGPDEFAAARERLLAYLTAQAPSPELAPAPDAVADFAVEPVEEFLLFIPPDDTNRLFLEGPAGIRSFAPSEVSVADALAAARAGA